eukprot:3872618-Amphidinium_carterae.1
MNHAIRRDTTSKAIRRPTRATCGLRMISLRTRHLTPLWHRKIEHLLPQLLLVLRQGYPSGTIEHDRSA